MGQVKVKVKLSLLFGGGADYRGSEIRFPAGTGNLSLHNRVQTVLGPTPPHIQWKPGALSLGIKQPVREADHLPPSSAKVKNAWSYNSTPKYVFMAWCLVNHRDFIYTCMTCRNVCIIYV
jgi:hypothetical protein